MNLCQWLAIGILWYQHDLSWWLFALLMVLGVLIATIYESIKDERGVRVHR